MSGWTSANIPDQTGRTFVVTGANSGLGAESAKALVAAGANVILACRNTAKADAVASKLGPKATVAQLDLADLSSVRAFASSFTGADVLINNAGLMAVPLRRTADGFEMQIGTNHLGHFALTALLLPKITDRVVTVSSGVHQIGNIQLDDLNWEKRRYRRWQAYGDSKMANLMFGLELAKRLAEAGSSKQSFIAHPGYAATELQGRSENFMDAAAKLMNRLPIAQPAADGALPQLYAATMSGLPSGTYYGPTKLFGLHGAPGRNKYKKAADDADFRAALWAESEKLTGEKFDVSAGSAG
ncbi:putative oxidoreductase [Gordonia namibiensis NBRC 108229]|uniref:Putative oxidoreductase n=1 Tax=Gordonia namibiensis NBRC 108229 TaxID=1208314 RepID=K6X3B6_9ACTN|nr:oxidoreductase [Gordonia namibiensis]GAB98822.1 putative oxidoreductase [Gordonia namibiensis NBRC 108229]